MAKRAVKIDDDGTKAYRGDLCVEQAVNVAIYGEMTDRPKCVDMDLASFKIGLNDGLMRGSRTERARGMRRLAVAQLGTALNFDYDEFTERLSEKLKARFGQVDWDWANEEADGWCCLYDVCILLVEQASRNKTATEAKALRFELTEMVVQVLRSMKTPGSKFLSLTEDK